MTLTTLLPAAFPALALAHFAALLSPGQDFILIIGHSIRHNLKGSQFICVGVALGNLVYIAIAILGWTSIRDSPLLFSVIEILGALYLLWIGIKLLQSSKSKNILYNKEMNFPSPIKQLMLGLNSALLNPKNAIFYMSLMSVILGNDVTLTQQIMSGIWMAFAVLLWDLFIAVIIGLKSVQQHLKQSIHLIEKGAGCILIIFAIGLFI